MRETDMISRPRLTILFRVRRHQKKRPKPFSLSIHHFHSTPLRSRPRDKIVGKVLGWTRSLCNSPCFVDPALWHPCNSAERFWELDEPKKKKKKKKKKK